MAWSRSSKQTGTLLQPLLDGQELGLTIALVPVLFRPHHVRFAAPSEIETSVGCHQLNGFPKDQHQAERAFGLESYIEQP
jgi:hypothetical protein